MVQSKIKIGVVGVGKMGMLHLRKYLELPTVEVVGIYDPDVPTLQRLQSELGIPAFDSLAELFFECDAVSIASPTPTHYRLARQAFDSGTHVLLEKPVTQTVEEAEALVKLAKERNLVFQVGFLERFRFRSLTRGLDLNPVRFIECHRLSASLGREPSIDVVSDIMIHDLDLALSLIGETPCHVSAVGVSVLTPLFDLANVRLEFPSGAVANLNASRVSNRPERKFRVFSLSSYVSADLISNQATVHSRQEGRRIEQAVVQSANTDALAAQCLEFLSAIREKRPALVTGDDGLRALRYTQMIKEKIEERALWRPPLITQGPGEPSRYSATTPNES